MVDVAVVVGEGHGANGPLHVTSSSTQDREEEEEDEIERELGKKRAKKMVEWKNSDIFTTS